MVGFVRGAYEDTSTQDKKNMYRLIIKALEIEGPNPQIKQDIDTIAIDWKNVQEGLFDHKAGEITLAELVAEFAGDCRLFTIMNHEKRELISTFGAGQLYLQTDGDYVKISFEDDETLVVYKVLVEKNGIIIKPSHINFSRVRLGENGDGIHPVEE